MISVGLQLTSVSEFCLTTIKREESSEQRKGADVAASKECVND